MKIKLTKREIDLGISRYFKSSLVKLDSEFYKIWIEKKSKP